MNQPVHLFKLHATGNDFVVQADGPRLDAVKVCDRHTGIGGDGYLRILPRGTNVHGAVADLGMELVNADGSSAEMSGNGIRCLAWVAVQRGLVGDRFTVDTAGGVRSIEMRRDARGVITGASVDMGQAVVTARVGAVAGDTRYDADAVDIGNPHLVCFVQDVERVPVLEHGPLLEWDARFPERTNVHFVQVVGTNTLRMVIWERGAGATLSCGTGASASAAAASERSLVGPSVVVHVPGGVLEVDLDGAHQRHPAVRLGGPVIPVFECDVDAEVFS